MRGDDQSTAHLWKTPDALAEDGPVTEADLLPEVCGKALGRNLNTNPPIPSDFRPRDTRPRSATGD